MSNCDNASDVDVMLWMRNGALMQLRAGKGVVYAHIDVSL